MIYAYRCVKCTHGFDIVKSVKEMDVNENCPKCGDFAAREFVPTRIHIVGASVEDHSWNPAFGCVDKGRAHRKELAKRHGMIEVGNESPEKMLARDEQTRADAHKKRWEDD